MLIGVASDLMARITDFPDNLRMMVDNPPRAKTGCRETPPPQFFQDLVYAAMLAALVFLPVQIHVHAVAVSILDVKRQKVHALHLFRQYV